MFLYLSMMNVDGLYSQTIHIVDTYEKLEKHIIHENDTTYVINFWATWCVPCVKEMPYFQALHQKNQNQKIKVILVSLDFKKQIDTHLKPFIKKYNISADLVVMTDNKYNNWLHKIHPEWSGSIPATLIVNRKQRHFEEKEFDSYNELEDWVKSFQ